MSNRNRRAFSGSGSRSGRFTLTNSTSSPKAYEIIQTGSKSVYRFFNSGSKSFRVKQAGSAGQGITVDPGNSIDGEITNGVSIVVAGGESVEGIYDFVESNSTVRNGRYAGKIDLSKSPVIIQGRDGSTYRFFNSGESPFTIKYGGVDNIQTTIESGQSHDFVVKGFVQLTTESVSEVNVKVIYDFVEPGMVLRSGRFRHAPAPNATDKWSIINFTKYAGAAKPFLLYRLFNSGEQAVQIFTVSDLGEESVLKTLEPAQSFDLGFNAAGLGGNKEIWVRGQDHTLPFEGMYEFIGTDE